MDCLLDKVIQIATIDMIEDVLGTGHQVVRIVGVDDREPLLGVYARSPRAKPSNWLLQYGDDAIAALHFCLLRSVAIRSALSYSSRSASISSFIRSRSESLHALYLLCSSITFCALSTEKPCIEVDRVNGLILVSVLNVD